MLITVKNFVVTVLPPIFNVPIFKTIFHNESSRKRNISAMLHNRDLNHSVIAVIIFDNLPPPILQAHETADFVYTDIHQLS